MTIITVIVSGKHRSDSNPNTYRYHLNNIYTHTQERSTLRSKWQLGACGNYEEEKTME